MARKKDTEVETAPSRGDLEKGIKSMAGMNSAIGEEREKHGRVLAGLEKKGLHKGAFALVARLHKMEPVRCAAFIRHLKLYVDLLGLEAQGDLEDVIDDDDVVRGVVSLDERRPH